MANEDEQTRLWKKLTQLEGDLKAMGERLSHVEETRNDIKAVKQAVEQLQNESSHRAGATAARKWMIATIISVVGLALAVGRILVGM